VNAVDSYLLATRSVTIAPTGEAAVELAAAFVLGEPAVIVPERGVFPNMAAEHYHKIEAMSASGAKKMLRSPQHYRLMRDTPNEPTEAMEFGTAVHCCVLEPTRFDTVVKLAPEVNKRTKDGKAEWAAFQAINAGSIVLTPADYARVLACAAAVNDHPAASRLLDGAQTEVSLFWRDKRFGVPCKCRYDARNHGGVIDVKTTLDASPEGFARQAANLLYHVQGAHYCNGAEDVLDASPEFFAFICVESEPPHAVACYTLPVQALVKGAQLMDEALARYRDALAAGKWAGYPETINELQLPRWALQL
jgi:hypothetical protein